MRWLYIALAAVGGCGVIFNLAMPRSGSLGLIVWGVAFVLGVLGLVVTRNK